MFQDYEIKVIPPQVIVDVRILTYVRFQVYSHKANTGKYAYILNK
jgi:hypothetical protein